VNDLEALVVPVRVGDNGGGRYGISLLPWNGSVVPHRQTCLRTLRSIIFRIVEAINGSRDGPTHILGGPATTTGLERRLTSFVLCSAMTLVVLLWMDCLEFLRHQVRRHLNERNRLLTI